MSSPAGDPILLARLAMGTRFELLLCGDDPAYLRAAGEEALAEVERLEAQLSRFRPDSELSGVNARAAQEPVVVEPRFFALLERVRRLWVATAGAFDPTIAPLMALWGLEGSGDRRPGHPRLLARNGSAPARETADRRLEDLPSPEELAIVREAVGFEHVALDPEEQSVRFFRPGMSLDLGAIGKGYAIECAVSVLRDAGVTAALLHAGTSTVAAIGAPPGANAWRVAIRDPRVAAGSAAPHAAGEYLARVSLRDRALSVSAPHGKFFTRGGRRYGHVLDPRRGEPVEGALLAALVTDSPTEGDALSTALLVLGAAGAARVRQADPSCRGLVASPPPEGAAGGGALSIDWVGEPGGEIDLVEA